MKLLARASAGLIFWAFAFLLTYSLHGFGCAAAWHEVQFAGASLFRWMLIASWMLLIAGAVALILWAKQLPAGFEGRIALVSAFSGAIGIAVSGTPVATMSACV